MTQSHPATTMHITNNSTIDTYCSFIFVYTFPCHPWLNRELIDSCTLPPYLFWPRTHHFSQRVTYCYHHITYCTRRSCCMRWWCNIQSVREFRVEWSKALMRQVSHRFESALAVLSSMFDPIKSKYLTMFVESMYACNILLDRRLEESRILRIPNLVVEAHPSQFSCLLWRYVKQMSVRMRSASLRW